MQDLRASLFRTYSQVKQMRQQLGRLKAEAADAAAGVAKHKRRKANLEAVMDKLKVSLAQAMLCILMRTGKCNLEQDLPQAHR